MIHYLALIASKWYFRSREVADVVGVDSGTGHIFMGINIPRLAKQKCLATGCLSDDFTFFFHQPISVFRPAMSV